METIPGGMVRKQKPSNISIKLLITHIIFQIRLPGGNTLSYPVAIGYTRSFHFETIEYID